VSAKESFPYLSTQLQIGLGIMPQSVSAQDTFALLLLHHKHGYPLWVPEPNMSLPPALYAEGIRIGDVGLVNQNGYFTSLFNIFRDKNDPVNTWNGVPPDFQPLELRQNLLDRRNNYHRAKVPVCSKHARQVMLNVDGTVLAPCVINLFSLLYF